MAKKRPAKRRPKGSGTLRPRGSRWHAEIRIQTSLGKKLVRQSFRTKKAAELWLEDMAKRDSVHQSDPTAPLTPLVERWLTLSAKGAAPNTNKARRYFTALAKPATDVLTLSVTSPIKIEETLAEIPGLTPYQYRRVFEAMSQFYRWCVRMGEIPASPMASLDPPPYESKKPRPLSQQQCRDFIAHAKASDYHSLFVVLIVCGLRPGEAFSLQWEDVDLEKGTILIQHNLEDINGHVRLKNPKTKGSRRTIELPPIAQRAMADHAAKGGRTGYVWKNYSGKPIRRSNFVTNIFKPLLKRAGLPPIALYGLRHTAVTMMLLMTKNVRRTASVSGHNARTLLATYAHLIDVDDDRFVDQVDAAFREKPADNAQDNAQSAEQNGGEDELTPDDDDA